MVEALEDTKPANTTEAVEALLTSPHLSGLLDLDVSKNYLSGII